MTIIARRISQLTSMFALTLFAACDSPSAPVPAVATQPAPAAELVVPLIDDLVVSEHYTLDGDDEQCPTIGDRDAGSPVDTDLALTNVEFAAMTADELQDLCLFQDPSDGSYRAADCDEGAKDPQFAAAPRIFRGTGEGCSFCGDNSILCGNKPLKKSGLVWCGILGSEPCVCGGISFPASLCC